MQCAEALSPVSSSDLRQRDSRAGLGAPSGPSPTPRGGPAGSSSGREFLLPARFLASSLPPPLAASELPFRPAPGASALPLPMTSVRRAGDQVGTGFAAGRRPDRRHRRRSHPAAARLPRPGRDRRGRRGKGPPRLGPQPRRRLAGRLAFHHRVNSNPEGPQESARGGDRSLRAANRGRCAGRNSRPPPVGIPPPPLTRDPSPHPPQAGSLRPARRKPGSGSLHSPLQTRGHCPPPPVRDSPLQGRPGISPRPRDTPNPTISVCALAHCKPGIPSFRPPPQPV